MKKVFLFALLVGSVGCGSVGQVSISDQRLVSKPNMLFSQSGVFVYQNRLIAQIEPGSASSGGGQAAGAHPANNHALGCIQAGIPCSNLRWDEFGVGPGAGIDSFVHAEEV